MKITANRSLRISITLSLLFLTGSFDLLHYGLIKYGIAFFVLLPIVVGLSIGALPNKAWSLAGLFISLICLISGLLMLT